MTRLSNVIGAAAAAFAAVVALSACSSSGSGSGTGSTGSNAAGGSGAAAGSPINILAIVDQSGPSKAYGTQELEGLKAAVKYYNAKGGLAGHKVNVTALDDNGDPATATSLAVKTLSANPGKYTMVYPGSEGTEIAALIPIMKRYKVYSIALDDGAAGCKSASDCPTEFSLVGDPGLAEQQSADYFKSKGYKKIGILEESVDFTQSETPPLTAALKKDGITYDKVSFPSSAVSVTSEMSQLKSDGVQAVYAEVLGPPAGYTLKAREQMGWNVPVVFDIAGSSLDITKLASPSQIKNAFVTAPYCADTSQNIPAFAQLRKYAPGLDGSIPCNLSGNGWDAVVLLKDALAQAKSTSTDALVQATEHLNARAQTDPDYIVYPKIAYTTTNHENVAQTPDTFKTLPVGPIVGTQLHHPAAG